MLYNEPENSETQDSSESVLPYTQLKGLVRKILSVRVKRPSDADDISQDVFRRSWQWANKHNKSLSTEQWKRLIAKITFNEISRFYSKKTEVLTSDHISDEAQTIEEDPAVLNPQFVLEIAEQLRKLSFRQRLSVVLFGGEILPYLKIILPDSEIAALLEVDEEFLSLLEDEIPLTEDRIAEVIEIVSEKECRSSIRDERAKGRKILRRRLFRK